MEETDDNYKMLYALKNIGLHTWKTLETACRKQCFVVE